MANFVTPSDFKGMVMIPQVGASINTGTEIVTPVNVALEYIISEKEPEVLTNLFGYNLYYALANGNINIERWDNLVNGTVYEIDGIKHFYPGLKQIIKKYVYYWWLRQEATQSTGVGESINKTENAVRTNPAQKQVTAWNDMIELCKSTLHYLYINQSVYPEYIVPSNSGCIEFYLENSYGWYNFNYLGYGYRCRRNPLLIPINTLSI
jgi:hypothetical protein